MLSIIWYLSPSKLGALEKFREENLQGGDPGRSFGRLTRGLRLSTHGKLVHVSTSRPKGETRSSKGRKLRGKVQGCLFESSESDSINLHVYQKEGEVEQKDGSKG